MLATFVKKFKRKLELKKLYNTDRALWRVEKAREKGVVVGEGCRFYSANFFSEPYLVEIGENVIVSGDVKFVTHDGAILVDEGNRDSVLGHYGRIRVGDNTFIGMNAVILPNVAIGKNCIIGAGSVVIESVPNDSVVLGCPAKVIFKTSLYLAMKQKSPNTLRTPERHTTWTIPSSYKREFILENLPPLKNRKKAT